MSKTRKHIRYDLMPRRYNFSWDAKTSAIVMSIHRRCAQLAPIYEEDFPIVKDYLEQFPLDDLFEKFSGDLGNPYFGLGERIIRGNDVGDYTEFSIPLPCERTNSHHACTYCSGTGKDQYDDACLRCSGQGKVQNYDPLKLYQTAASLNLLLYAMDCIEEVHPAAESQLVEVHTLVRQERQGGGLGGHFGIELCSYLCSDVEELKRGTLAHIANTAMIQATEKIKGKANEHQIWSRVHNGEIHLHCEDGAREIHSAHPGEMRHQKSGEGQEFVCHNVDTPAQQLILISGIAAITGHVSAVLADRCAVAG